MQISVVSPKRGDATVSLVCILCISVGKCSYWGSGCLEKSEGIVIVLLMIINHYNMFIVNCLFILLYIIIYKKIQEQERKMKVDGK